MPYIGADPQSLPIETPRNRCQAQPSPVRPSNLAAASATMSPASLLTYFHPAARGGIGVDACQRVRRATRN
jgi:hypothetical protein